MKIVAKKGRRLALFIQGKIIRTRYIDENGVFDGIQKKYIAKYAEVDEVQYYRKALACGDAEFYSELPISVTNRVISVFEEPKKENKRGK